MELQIGETLLDTSKAQAWIYVCQMCALRFYSSERIVSRDYPYLCSEECEELWEQGATGLSTDDYLDAL